MISLVAKLHRHCLAVRRPVQLLVEAKEVFRLARCENGNKRLESLSMNKREDHKVRIKNLLKKWFETRSPEKQKNLLSLSFSITVS